MRKPVKLFAGLALVSACILSSCGSDKVTDNDSSGSSTSTSGSASVDPTKLIGTWCSYQSSSEYMDTTCYTFGKSDGSESRRLYYKKASSSGPYQISTIDDYDFTYQVSANQLLIVGHDHEVLYVLGKPQTSDNTKSNSMYFSITGSVLKLGTSPTNGSIYTKI
jgi:hypothetical protein